MLFSNIPTPLPLKNDAGHVSSKHRPTRENSVILPTADVTEELTRLFKKADTTADGKISLKELAWSISKYETSYFGFDLFILPVGFDAES